MTMNGSLLAKKRPKSGAAPPEILLIGHTSCVLHAVDALFDTDGEPTRLARSWLRFFGLAESEFARFRRHLRVAAAAHDWGKANDGFQIMVGEGGEQVVRHEHLSGFLLADVFVNPEISSWLEAAGLDKTVLLSAVVGHHVKAGMNRSDHPVGALTGKKDSLHFCSDHADFKTTWRMIRDEVGGAAPEPIVFPKRLKKEDIRRRGDGLRAVLDGEKSRLREDRVAHRWIAAVRAGLIAADAVGSAVVRMDGDPAEPAEEKIGRWVRECFATTLTADDVWREVVLRRIDDLCEGGRWDRSTGHTFRGEGGFKRFQCDIASAGPRVLMTASCGSGKTLAAWNWITAQLDDRAVRGCPASRVLFLYPTRATATEGFRDYVSWAPEDDAGLLSGTAAYELQDMFATPDDAADPRQGRSYQANARLFALGHWKKRIFSATADQFFPFMQYAYGPLCLLPLLVESIVVVDEVHSFDRSMFSTLRRFLKEFPEVPVLCMTATLSPERRRELVDADGCRLVAYPETRPPDLQDDATHPRYHVEWIDREGARSLVLGELHNRRRVLWVSNRVDECQATFESFGDLDDAHDDHGLFKCYCYHSRFKLADRKERHNDLIRAFQYAAGIDTKRRGILGATTQVCEMSLDLDAEVLVTDLAPIAALIQRMGRCNRDSTKMRGRPIGRVYVLRPEPDKEKPYEKHELDAAVGFVNAIVGRGISQDELARIYEKYDPREIEPEKLCPFLDSGPYADAKEESFREIDEFTVPCVLDDDLRRWVGDKLKSSNPADRVIDGFIVPVPRRFATETKPEASWFPRWLSVARMSAYDELVGFEGRKLFPAEGGDA